MHAFPKAWQLVQSPVVFEVDHSRQLEPFLIASGHWISRWLGEGADFFMEPRLAACLACALPGGRGFRCEDPVTQCAM